MGTTEWGWNAWMRPAHHFTYNLDVRDMRNG